MHEMLAMLDAVCKISLCGTREFGQQWTPSVNCASMGFPSLTNASKYAVPVTSCKLWKIGKFNLCPSLIIALSNSCTVLMKGSACMQPRYAGVPAAMAPWLPYV